MVDDFETEYDEKISEGKSDYYVIEESKHNPNETILIFKGRL